MQSIANEDEVSQIEDGRQGEIEDPPGEVDRHREDEGGPWYFGKAKEEFHRRRGQGRTSQIEEDPIKVLFLPYFLKIVHVAIHFLVG